MIKRLSVVMALLIVMATYSTGAEVPQQTVKIGLLGQYTNIPAIHIENDELQIGYWVDGIYESEAVFSSASGFEFTAYPGMKGISKASFPVYEDAMEVVNMLRSLELPAYAGTATIGVWRIYLGNSGEDKNAVSTYTTKASELAGFQFYQTEDNGERVMMDGAGPYAVVLENSVNLMPCVAATDIGDGILDLGSRSYRGTMEIARDGLASVSAVNVIYMEQYLYGVLPGEIIPSWPEESLKAQAVAARTYAAYYAFEHPKYPNKRYDLGDDVYSQVYKGCNVEKASTNNAVDATVGEMIYYNGNVIPTYFFASSGGHTENSENVWSGTVPYLKGVPDIYEQDPERDPWIVEMTGSEIGSILQSKGISIGSVKDIEVKGYTDAGRALSLKITGSSGSYTLEKETIRYWLGLNSRKFQLLKADYSPQASQTAINGILKMDTVSYNNANVISGSGSVKKFTVPEQVIVISAENIVNHPMVGGKNGSYIFAGEGWGHGIGMSQSGAKGMALEGYKYDEILTYYYSGVAVE